jgi:hypothetical protein
MEPITRHLKTKLSIELNFDAVPEDQYDALRTSLQRQANLFVDGFNLKRYHGASCSCQEPGLTPDDWVEAVNDGRTELGYWQWLAHRRSIRALQGEG